MKLFLITITSIVVLYVTAFSPPAVAQADPDDISKKPKMCAAIASDLERLSCYDDLSHQVMGNESARESVSPPPKATSQPATSPMEPASNDSSNAGTLGAWLRNDEIDGLDNSKIIILSLPAESGYVGLIGKSGVKRGPVLVLRCKEHQAHVFVSFDLPVTGSEEGVAVQIRNGANQPIRGVWSRSEDETSFGSWKAATTAPLINQFALAGELFVRARGSNGRTSEALFALDGIKAAINAIQEGCQW
jgi:type VI secretion system VasI family protein